MHLADGIRSAFSSILSHKLRSALTITGIVIGVLAVVSMFSSVYALKKLISSSMADMGWNHSLDIYPGSTMRYGRSDASANSRQRTIQNIQPLSLDDYLALKEQLSYKIIHASVESGNILRVGNEDNMVSIKATENSFFAAKKYELSNGSYFSKLQEDGAHPVAILGYKFADEYFPKQNPIGQTLVLGQHRFRIIGILESERKKTGAAVVSFNSWQRDNDLKAVYVPLKYGAYYLVPNKAIHHIYLQAHNEKEFTAMKAKARQLLLARHNMYPNFSFMDVGDFFLQINKEIDAQMKKWNITLSAIASISLLVGGVGLFSTLLISIQERMTEIGMRKSIGATEQDIFFYFIMESLCLALLGALLGLGIAWLLIISVSQALEFSMVLPWQGAALGLGFSLLIGFISGLYPALKASNTDPIKAIFYHD
ncbi:MAG: ABC transporter permease [Candidatus Cloacimonetes bacterium]|nr:ABC transporter permease [Candidatus Cloacimonadota bacterium]